MAGTFINDRNIATDVLITDKIMSDPSKGTSSVNVSGVTISSAFASVVSAVQAGGAPVVQVGTASPISGSAVIQLYSKYTGTPFLLASASATNQVMDQFTLPAGTLTTGHALRFTVYGIHAADTNAGTLSVTFGSAAGAYQTTVSGGTNISTTAGLAVSGGVWSVELDFFQSAASVQRSNLSINPGGTALVASVDTSLTQDMTSSKLVTLALNTAVAAASCTIYGWTVQLI